MILAMCVTGGPHSVHRTRNGSLDRRHGQTARSARLKFRGVRHPLVYPEGVGYVLCRIAYRERVFGTWPNAPNSNAGLGVPAQEVDATLPEICSRSRANVRLADYTPACKKRYSWNGLRSIWNRGLLAAHDT